MGVQASEVLLANLRTNKVRLDPGDPVNVQLVPGGGDHVEVQLELGDPVNVQLEPGGGDHAEVQLGDVADEEVEGVALVVGGCKVVVACCCSRPVSLRRSPQQLHFIKRCFILRVPKGRHSERRHLIPLFTFLESSKSGEYFFIVHNACAYHATSDIYPNWSV